jgi:hypothetical protein
MAYVKVQQYNTMSSSEMNANFQYIGSGTKLPAQNQDLENTNGSLNLGSSTYRWNTLYADNSNFSGTVSNTWTRIASTTLDSESTSIEFSGLNGDTDIMYKLIAYVTGQGMSVASIENKIVLNQDSSSSYGYQEVRTVLSTLTTAGRVTLQSFITLQLQSQNRLNFYEMLIYAKTGYERLLTLKNIEEGYNSYIDNYYMRNAIWNNKVDTLTSIKLYSSGIGLGVDTHIELYARR